MIGVRVEWGCNSRGYYEYEVEALHPEWDIMRDLEKEEWLRLHANITQDRTIREDRELTDVWITHV